MKVKLFSHTDLDGVGCGVVAKLAFKDNVDISYCNYDKINHDVAQFLNEGQYQLYDQVYITDISVDETVASKINELHEEGKLQIHLIDHHPTAEWLNKYKWATVNPYHTENAKSSGTSMFYFALSDNPDLFMASKFVEKVRRYDTWEWNTKYNDLYAKQLNDLLYIIGRGRFIQRFTKNISPDFTTSEQLLLDLEQEKIDRYIESKEKNIYRYEMNNYKVGVVFAEQYQSQLGNELSKSHPEFDLIAMINMSDMTVSYRTVRDDINVGLVAKMFGGGGHPKAAGSQFELVALTAAINSVFPV